MSRPIAAAVCLAAALALAGCGGAEKDTAGTTPSAAPTTLAPIPAVRPAAMKPLAGRWVGTAKDYFQFSADGTGAWVRAGHRLWSGRAIPEGGGAYRFSWKGGDPRVASHWGVSINDDKTSLTFAGTNQTYKRVPEGKR